MKNSRTTKPNVVFIMADQWAAASLGCYGCRVPDVTPNLDKLVKSGIRFDRNYANIPLCAPCRATIFTGRSPVVHGILYNDMNLSDDCPTFASVLKQDGYETYGIGKFHFSSMFSPPPDNFTHLGFDKVIVTEDPRLGSWLDWIAEKHPRYYERALATIWETPYLSQYGSYAEDLRDARKEAAEKWLTPRRMAPNRQLFFESPLPVELHQTRWITDCAIDAISGRQNSEATPFFLYVSYVAPHDPYDPPYPYSSLYDWRDMPKPIHQEWTDCASPAIYKEFMQNNFEFNTYNNETWARLRAHHYASGRFVDDEIGRLIAYLEKTGLADNTYFVFTTDHGDMVGDHGLSLKGPWHYDSCIRTPLIISGPEIYQGQVFGNLTCALDIFPTILNLTSTRCDIPLEGLAIPVKGERLKGCGGHDNVAVESNGIYQYKKVQSRTIIADNQYRLTLFANESYGELFNLREDPSEQINLYNNPDHISLRMELEEKLIVTTAKQILPFPLKNRAEGVKYD